MTITSQDVKDFIGTFSEPTQQLVNKFVVDDRKSDICKNIVTNVLNKKGYNSSLIKGEFKATDTLPTLYKVIITDIKTPSLLTRITGWLFGNILVRILCHLLELEYVVVKNNPEREEEIVNAMILTGLYTNFNRG